MDTCRRGLVGWPYIPRLKISHRLFAARCIAAIVDRGRLLSRCYCPKPRLCLRCLRVAHDAPDYWPARVTEPHIVVVLVPKVGSTAFASGYKNKLCVIDFRICHRCRALRWEPSAGSSRRVSLPYLQSRTPNLPIVEPVREIVVCFERILLETDTS